MLKRVVKISFCVILMSIASLAKANEIVQFPFDINKETQILSSKARTLNPEALRLGLKAYLKARAEGFAQQSVLTIVDYTKASTQPRLYVFDLKNNNLLFRELVTHGKNSGDNYAISFSNQASSLKSSIGLFLTKNAYFGHHGYSLKLAGLEKGFNDMAAARAIVVHAGSYASATFARFHGRLGKSFGCFAVRPEISSTLIDTIKNGSLIFAYYPDRNYLSHSSFVSGF